MRHYQTSDNRNEHRNTPHNRSNTSSRFNQLNRRQNRAPNQTGDEKTVTQFYNDDTIGASDESRKAEQQGGSSNPLGQLAQDPSGLIQSILKFIPPGIYNRETKKIFGILTAEDLLLAALILMLADSDDNDDTALLIALVYILMG